MMDISFEQYQAIQRYLDQQMTAPEQEQFEQLLAEDANLANALDLEQALRSGAAFSETTEQIPDIRSIVQQAGGEWRKEQDSADKSRGRIISMTWFKRVAAAASIIIVAGVAFLLTRNKEGKQPAIARVDTATKAAPPDTQRSNPPARRSDTVSPVADPPGELAVQPAKIKKEQSIAIFDSALSRDLVPFENGGDGVASIGKRYASGETKLIIDINIEDVPTAKGDDDQLPLLDAVHYYKGLSYLDNKRYNEAAKEFSWVLKESKQQDLVGRAKWYRALLYIRSGQSAEAKALLSDLLKDQQARFHEQASALISSLP